MKRTDLMKLVAALCVLSTFAFAGPLDEEPTKDPEPVSASLSFTNPWFAFNGKKVQWVAVGIDGRDIKTCSTADRVKSESCGKESVEPGVHIIQFAFTTEEDNFRGDATRFVDRVTFGVREDVEVDMGRAVADASAQKATTRKTRPGKSPVPCLAMVETAAYAPACTGDELKAAAASLSSAWQVCAKQETWSDEQKNTLRGLLSTASSNWFGQEIARCYSDTVLKHVGRVVTSYGPSDFFPRELVKSGSWQWAREGFDADAASGKSLKVHAELLGAAAITSAEKVAMVDAFITSQSKKDFTAIRDAVMASKFTLDPNTVAGHRLWLVAGALENDSVFSEWLAKQVKAEKSVNCGMYEEEELLVKALLYPKLSRAGYEAIVAMSERTPPTDQLFRCNHIGGANIKSDVPATERFTWLVNFDCSTKRAPEKRGNSLGSYFGGKGSAHMASEADQEKLRPLYEKCTAKKK